MKTVSMVAAFAIFLAANYMTFILIQDADAMAWWGERFPAVIVAMTAMIMLAGIFLGCLFRRITDRPNQTIDVGAELRGVLRSTSFVAALCVAPFVFMSVYVVVNKSPGDPASYLLAFQNGFFCEAVFGKLFVRGAPAAGTDQN